MKVLFIRKQYDFHGGAERYLEALIDKLLERHVDVQLLCSEWAGLCPPDLRVHHVPIGRRIHFLESADFAREAAEFVKENEFDVVFSLERTSLQDIYRAGDGLHQIWLERKRMFSSPIQRLALHFNPLHRTLCALERKTFDPKNTGFVIANSPMVKKEIISHAAFPEERIEVIVNGVDTNKFSPCDLKKKKSIRNRFNLPEDKFIFLLIGSGFFRKGVRFAIDFIKSLRRSDIMLLVVGRGKLPRGVDRKLVCHHFGATSVNEVYRAADAFILPTLYDPFANVVLEAMASGLPVITTAYNGASDFIVEGQEGWIWKDLHDVKSIVERVQPLFDPETCERMKQAVCRKAKEFTMDRNAEATLALIRKVAVAKEAKLESKVLG